MISTLADIVSFSEQAVLGFLGIFVRVIALVGLLPGFGEQSIPMRIKLAAALSFSLIVWPAVLPDLPPLDATARVIVGFVLNETLIGLILGLSVRLLVMALQFAGSIAAQSTSLAQIFGPGATPDPMPAVGNILIVSGIALALTLGLHVKVAQLLVYSYTILPFGITPAASDVSEWGVGRAAHAFGLAFSLAAPFLIASFAYNIALGAINRAMPQLMVAFIGAPAITGAGILLLLMSGPVLLLHWESVLDGVLLEPLKTFP